jgi:hypothetical protein
MRRGHLGWVALCCWAASGAACTPRKEAVEPAKEAPASAAPASPTPVPPQSPDTKEPTAMATPLDCTMSVPAQVRAGQPVEVSFKLTNPTSRPLHVLRWLTPLEGLMGSLFQVTRDGAEVPYRGPMLKRGDPAASDYTTVAPGASVEAKVEASLAYDFSQPGRYRIAFRDELMDVATDTAEVPHSRDRFQQFSVKCPAVETTVSKP